MSPAEAIGRYDYPNHSMVGKLLDEVAGASWGQLIPNLDGGYMGITISNAQKYLSPDVILQSVRGYHAIGIVRYESICEDGTVSIPGLVSQLVSGQLGYPLETLYPSEYDVWNYYEENAARLEHEQGIPMLDGKKIAALQHHLNSITYTEGGQFTGTLPISHLESVIHILLSGGMIRKSEALKRTWSVSNWCARANTINDLLAPVGVGLEIYNQGARDYEFWYRLFSYGRG